MFTEFWDSGAPLTGEQKSALAQLFAKRTPALTRAGGSDVSPDLLRTADESMLNGASAFLTPEQVRILRNRVVSDNEYARIARD